MHTIILKVDDKIYDKLLGLLNKFSKDEIEIVAENSSYYNDRKYLEDELNEIISGKAKFSSVEDAEIQLENRISKHENPS